MRKRVVAHGRVQGVWFRQSTRQHAEAAGVAGWVLNRRDGAVEAVLEGDADAVERLVAWIRDGGPGRAEVDRVEVSEEEPEGLRGFDIR
jgi:acylphosphatase